MFKHALESMDAQLKSKLGSELEALWQEVIDYRDKELKGNISFDNKVSAIQTFFQKKTAKRFMDIVWKNTGLNVEAVFFKPHFESQFCTYMCYGKTTELTANGTQQLEGILNGQANVLVDKWFPVAQEFSVDDMLAIAKSFDIQKGIIKPEYREKMKKWIRCAMGFDISLGFLSKDYLPPNSGVEYFTARELTAIMLHEIGHNLTIVEHAADMYAHISSFRALREAFEKRATPEQAVDLAKKVAAMGTKAGFVKDSANLMKVAMQADKDVVAAGKKIHKQGRSNFVFGMVGSAFTLLFDVITRTMDVLVADPTRAAFRHRAGQKKKLGDVAIGDRMYTWQERKADEYAFDHGYGADQVTALEKIGRFYSLIGRSEKDIREILKAEASGKDLSVYTKLRLSHMAHVMMGNPQFRLYPPGAERYKDILELTIKELKAHGASAEYVARYTEDITRILRSIDEMSKEDKYFDEAYQRYKMFLKFCSVRSFANWLVNGRIDTELQECMDNIRRLNNNLITYFGSVLDKLAKEK